MELLICDTVDISDWTGFRYYELCQYWDNQSSAENPKIGICLGKLHRGVSALC